LKGRGLQPRRKSSEFIIGAAEGRALSKLFSNREGFFRSL
jgi:hypothetical protein